MARHGSSVEAPSAWGDLPAAFGTVSLPLATLCKVELAQKLGQPAELRLAGKDTRAVRVAVEGGRGAVDGLGQLLRANAFPQTVRGVFAFKCANATPLLRHVAFFCVLACTRVWRRAIKAAFFVVRSRLLTSWPFRSSHPRTSTFLVGRPQVCSPPRHSRRGGGAEPLGSL